MTKKQKDIPPIYWQIYHYVQQIPPGKVVSYGDLAQLIPTSARLVGQALHHNPQPETIPCHRVVFSDGKLAKQYAFGGKQKQAQKLRAEKVPFLDPNRVNLRHCRWRFR